MVLNAAWELHQIQVSVVELLDKFSRALPVLDLHTLYLAVADAQATHQVFGFPLQNP